ncbi:MAG: hypothetical protein CVV50_02900 [Spirochaetae bacterium HGW-Spirochaetae-6]|nr:MAG: hypothetical protein CVV50_02900 [Spirochaetae bacterium HGW-Spirochaetae-6]
MIAGNAMGFLEEFMLDCDIVPPKAYIGKDTDLFTAQTKLGVIEFNSPSGDFNIYVVMEESPSEMAGVLTFNIPEIINNHIIDMFIPKGISVYTTKTREETIKVLESQQDVMLLFLNQMYTANTDFTDFIQVILSKRPACHIIFYSVQSEWEPRLIERFPNSVLGFIPRAFDTAKIFQTLVMILNKLGVKYHHKRNFIRIKVTPKDNIPALLYKNLREETENIVNVSVEDLSVGGALLVLPFTSKDDFKPKQILPRAQIKLKGYVVRFKAEIMQKVENKIAVRFLDITNDDIKKLSHFIHDKLRDTVLKEILTK